MTFIFDRSDPNGQGMFSKAGRITSAKYVVFQKKAEILENQRKFLKVSALPLMRLDLEQQKEEQNKNFLEEEHVPKPKVVVQKRERPQTAPFELQISREYKDKINSNRHPPPAVGTYNPKHSILQKTTSTLFEYSKEKAKPLESERAATARPATSLAERQADLDFNPDKLAKKINGVGLFYNQTSRDQFSRPSSRLDVHEQRFIYHGLPASFSKTRRVPGFNLNSQEGRESENRRNQRALPDYHPNHEFGKRQLGTSGPSFEKRTGRKDASYVSYSINDDFFNVDQSLLLKFPRQKDIDFAKDLPRERTSSNPLPSFMQKGNNSRLGTELRGQKTLEINNFSEGRFQSNTSSFTPRPQSAVRYSTKLNTWRI